MNDDYPGKRTNSDFDWRRIARLGLKVLLILLLLNLVFALFTPMPVLGNLSLYNRIFPGRRRLPYGDDPELSFNMSLTQLDGMFSSHEIDAAVKGEDEFRVVLIGDSSVWGFLLHPHETLTSQINALDVQLEGGKRITAHNLGYPTMSLAKDFLIMERAMAYEPDLIIWLMTLESFPRNLQLDSPVIQSNPVEVLELLENYDLKYLNEDGVLSERSFWENTILGQRRVIADIVRHQIYGVLWAATSVDHHIPETYNPRVEDLEADETFQRFEPGGLQVNDLAFDVIRAGIRLVGDIPILIVNEPIFVSEGQNSDIRYNFYYPRWAYDGYRNLMISAATNEGWRYIDAWDIIPSKEFTDSSIHYTVEGVSLFARILVDEIVAMDPNDG